MNESKKNLIKNALESALRELDIKYKNDDDRNAIIFSLGRSSPIGSLDIYIFYYDEAYTIRAVMGSHASSSVRNRVGEFLHRANYGLKNGDFEFDYSDGEISYKVHVNLTGMTPSDESIKRNLVIPVAMFEKYGEGIMKTMFSKDKPEAIIKGIEQS